MLLMLFAGSVALLSNAATKLASNMPLALTAIAQAAPDKRAIPGELMAYSCAGCHGTQGRLGDEFFMPLAGMPGTQTGSGF